MKTIKDVRAQLRFWGAFWARHELGQGYASKSNIEALRETLQVGCRISGTSHQVNHLSDSIKVPADVNVYDNMIKHLPLNSRRALRQRYVLFNKVFLFKDKHEYLYWLKKAELALL